MDDSSDTRIMRSIYLDRQTDTLLRELAFKANVTKSALIRAAIAEKIDEWMADPQKTIADVRAQKGGAK